MWLLNARRRVTLPDPVTLKRFAAARLVFCFGIVVDQCRLVFSELFGGLPAA
jgi:hypothetical protein